MKKIKNNIDKELKALSKKHKSLQNRVNHLIRYRYSDAFTMSTAWAEYSHSYSLSNIQTAIDVAKTLTSKQMDAMLPKESND